MKRFSTIVISILLNILLASCTYNEPIVEGTGTPIELNMDSVVFSTRGGNTVLRSLNTMITPAELVDLQDSTTIKRAIKPILGERNQVVSISDDGIMITPIDKSSLSIIVDSSDKVNKWLLTVRSGNVFKKVSIYQHDLY